ncbi:MAG: YtxH domain-containing protein [Candidatus Binatia bacterium]
MNHQTGSIMFSGLAFLTGLMTGIGTGLLLAPRPGVQTRRQLRHLADDIGGAASRLAGDARQTADLFSSRGNVSSAKRNSQDAQEELHAMPQV